MSKNIILCSDGTGNKGGYTPDSNVYKMYNAIEIHDTAVSQYTFYDNGVGTSTNKYWRGFTGAFGVGFKHNIIDLYSFLALHYEEGDKVYLFGFSRGAATIRAFCGFIKTVGLVNGKGLTDKQLKTYAYDAFKAYESHLKDEDRAVQFRTHRYSHGIIDIHFVGVWDTVSALGFPKRTDKMGLTLNVLSYLFKGLEKLSDIRWPHRFYDFELSKNIKHAYQALAIDDERTAFWPRVWDEVKAERTADNVEQVWFSGMHSNVGGGYKRQGMANVALHWMMLRAKKHGLVFKPGIEDEVYQNSNIHGRLYNSRDGMAIYYRYHPREITSLCEDKLLSPIKVHNSTLERLKKCTANYTPVVLPDKFDVVESAPDAAARHIDISQAAELKEHQTIIESCINTRKKLYGRLADLTALVLIYIFYISPKTSGDDDLFDLIYNSLTNGDFVSLVKHLYEHHLFAIGITAIALIILYRLRTAAIDKMTTAAEKVRKIIVDAS